MNANQLHILQHSLGVDQYGQGKCYRDYYCVGIDHESESLTDIRAMVALGWMREGCKINEGRDQYFIVTQLGLSAMKGHSQPAPKLSRAKRRYQEFQEADCSMTFGEWLKWRHANRDRLIELGYIP